MISNDCSPSQFPFGFGVLSDSMFDRHGLPAYVRDGLNSLSGLASFRTELEYGETLALAQKSLNSLSGLASFRTYSPLERIRERLRVVSIPFRVWRPFGHILDEHHDGVARCLNSLSGLASFRTGALAGSTMTLRFGRSLNSLSGLASFRTRGAVRRGFAVGPPMSLNSLSGLASFRTRIGHGRNRNNNAGGLNSLSGLASFRTLVPAPARSGRGKVVVSIPFRVWRPFGQKRTR